MDVRACITKAILSAFTLTALFGIYGMVSFGHAAHMGCPSSAAQHSLCASPLEHLGHWQAVFTAVFAELVTLLSLAIVLLIGIASTTNLLQPSTWKLRRHEPPRPTLLQELFSQGILHRKEPQTA